MNWTDLKKEEDYLVALMGSFEQLKNNFKSLVQSQRESASNSLGMAESFQKVQNLSEGKLNEKVI